MKKILFVATLIASTTLGFAKEKIENANNSEKNEVTKKTEVKIYQFDSLEKAKLFMEECSSVTVAYQKTRIDDGNGQSHVEYILVSICEESHPCILETPGVVAYIIIV